MSDRTGEEQEDGKGLKKPLKGSFRRVGDRMAQEMDQKSPTEAVRDDLGGSSDRDEQG